MKAPSILYDSIRFSIADLFVKNDNNAKFDEKFFMYCEETDLQFKLMKQHKKRLIIDGPKIIHLEGASSNKTKLYPKSQIYASISRIIYLKNNFKPGLAILFLIKLITTLTWINPFIILLYSSLTGITFANATL